MYSADYYQFYYAKCYSVVILTFLFPIICGSNNANNLFDKWTLDIKNSPQCWYFKDFEADSVPGASLTRAYEWLQSQQKQEVVVVGLLDSKVAIKSKYLQHHIWKNPNEIANNGIDDDHNGYIDDINGWNFLGNNKGYNIIHSRYEGVRLRNAFENGEIDLDSSLYAKIKSWHEAKLEDAKDRFEYADSIHSDYLLAKDMIGHYFPNGNYDKETLNTIDTLGKKKLSKHVKFIDESITYGFNDSLSFVVYEGIRDIYKKCYNIEFDERVILNENSYDSSNLSYGNKEVANYLDKYTHGSRMASTISLALCPVPSTYQPNIEIMPVNISPHGDEHDKDIYAGIKYAVDNGARVINMSFGKEFSMHFDWVIEAFRYARRHGVLIVSSAGNGRLNLEKENNYYPNDNLDNGKELTDNFILVGNSTAQIGKHLKSKYSNYGKSDVDLFAPGTDFKTLYPNNDIRDDNGTSLSAGIVSHIAALIFSHYPDLTPTQVKQILMNSVTKYDVDVEIKEKNEKGEKITKMIPFSQLSKSGGIVNAYNALLLAEKVSKGKEK